MIHELSVVSLTHDVPEYHLKRGDVGAVVHIYPNHAAYEVEFVAAGGQTIALLTLLSGDIRAFGKGTRDLHARERAAA